MRVTDAERGVDGFAWRPDGREFAYVTDDEAPTRRRSKRTTTRSTVTKKPGRRAPTAQPAHIWLIRAERRQSAPAHLGNVERRRRRHHVPRGRQGDRIQPSARRHVRHFFRTMIAIADIATGNDHDVRRDGQHRPAFDRSGKLIAYVRPNATASVQNDVILADADGSHPVERRQTPRPQRRRSRFPPRRRRCDRRASTERARTSTASTARSRRDRADRRGQRRFRARSRATVRSRSAARPRATPSEIYLLRPDRERGRERLTSTNAWLGALGHRHEADDRVARRTDGTPLDAVVTEPPGFTKGKKYPLVL